MRLIHDLAALPDEYRGGLLTIGKFDGLHAGHAAILRTLTELAHKGKTASIVMTFDPAPAEILCPERVHPFLCEPEKKIELIESFYPDLLVLFPTTRAFLQLPFDEFFRTIVLDTFNASGMVEGVNFTFGRNREGNSQQLETLCRQSGLIFQMVPAVSILGGTVSSSRIRKLLLAGDTISAQRMLNRPYRMTGTVVDGEHRGRQLGFPTANLSEIMTILPKPGVYAASTEIDGRKYRAALNIGGNPTFGVGETKIEAHLLDFSGNIYGRRISLDFAKRIRDIVTFSSKEELIGQMNQDLAAIRTIPLE